MKIFILPYTFHTYFSYNTRVSGVDESMLKQMEVLAEAGHQVRAYIPFTNLVEHTDHDIVYHTTEDLVDRKEYLKKHKKTLVHQMENAIMDFSPDVILSNMYYQTFMYKRLNMFNTPIVYMSHAIPGFMSDLHSGNEVYNFTERHTLCCVSQYHVDRTKLYYSGNRKHWSFSDTIVPDDYVFSSYSTQESVEGSDGVVRHVSAANKEKQTFFVHDVLDGTDIKSEVFTTLKYMGKADKDTYVAEAMKKYNTDERPVHQDIEHSKIMSEIARSACCFVGLASYDTFTITSLEALSRGVPLIVKGYKGRHPATEMVEPEFSQYVHILENKNEFSGVVKKFQSMTLQERKDLAASCYRRTSKEQYRKSLERMLERAVEKYNVTNKSSLLAFL